MRDMDEILSTFNKIAETLINYMHIMKNIWTVYSVVQIKND